MLHLGPVVAGDAWRDGGVRHQLVDACCFEDVGGVLLQSLVVAHHAVVDLTRRTQFDVSHPVDDVLAELPVHVPASFHVAQVADKVLEAEAGAGVVAVSVALAVLANDGWSDIVLVPWLEARVLHKFVFECRDEALKGVSHNEEFKV